jgi:tetratricopeptide (TPR) repeat protein
LAVALVALAVRGEVSVAAPEGAESPFQQALAAYDAGRYAEAIERFEALYQRTHAPALLFNIAQSARLLGDCARAIEYYRRFVAQAPASHDRPRAEARLAELATCPTKTPPEAPPPATPPPAPPPPAPPSPSTAPTIVASAPKPTPPFPRRASVLSLALLGTSATLGGAAAVSAWQATSDSSHTSSLFRDGGDWDASAQSIDRDGHRAQALFIAFATGAVVTAGVGLFLMLRRTNGGER